MNLLIGIILSFTFLVVGFLLGNVFPVKALRGDTDEDEIVEVSPAQVLDEDGEVIEVEGEPQAVAAAPPRPGLRKYVQFWREENSKKLVTQVEDELVDYGEDLNEDQRGRLSLILVDLQAWIGLETQMKAVEEREAANKAAPQVGPSPAPEPLPNENKGLRINPIKMLRKGIEADGKLPVDYTPVSIPAQIDEILQDSLTGTEFEDKGIELEDVPGKGMVVHVGMESYEGIDEVPDSAVQAVIRSAVAEWENRVSQI